METEQTKLKPVELGSTGVIVLPKIDVEKYVGTRAKIATVTEHEGEFGYFIKIETEVFDTIKGGKEPIEIKASRMFGLQQDENNNIGWGEDTKLGIFLAKKGVAHYKDLVGMDVIVQTVTNKNDKKDYLSFN